VEPVRAPFEVVRAHDEILERAALIGKTDPIILYRQYLCLLDICGWSKIDYENELLRIIDLEWIRIHNKVYG
jgi:hypothetical protein